MNRSHEQSQEKMKCHNHGVHCMNDAVGEADLADGRGVKFYCRKCMIDSSTYDPVDIEEDDSLIFCEREWDEQELTG